MKKKISVIVPIYNVEAYLPKCIESIINQSYKNIEIILVDDGSTDGSGTICDSYEKSDDRISVIHKQNGGLVSARKAGLKQAQGEYIGFVDGDDYIDECFYEVLYDAISKSDADFAQVGCVREADSNKNMILPLQDATYDVTEEREQLMQELLLDTGKVITGVVMKLFKHDIVVESYASVPDGQDYAEDLICTCEVLLQARKMVSVREALYHYVIRNNSIIQKTDVMKLVETAKWADVVRQILRKAELYESLHMSLETRLLRGILLSLRQMPQMAGSIHYYRIPNVQEFAGKKVILYGAGKVGQDYYVQLAKQMDCELVAWVDKNSDRYNFDYAEVAGVNTLLSLTYDYIIVAIQNESVADEIISELVALGIAKDKLRWIPPERLV